MSLYSSCVTLERLPEIHLYKCADSHLYVCPVLYDTQFDIMSVVRLSEHFHVVIHYQVVFPVMGKVVAIDAFILDVEELLTC